MSESIDKNFERVRAKAELSYKEIGEISCPYLNDSVSFNSKGLEHLKFKSKRKVRERRDAYMRLKNVHLAPQILKLSRTLQEKQTKKIFVDVKTNSRNEKIMKGCTYYGFTAIVEDGNFEKRLKVIVRQVMEVKNIFGVLFLIGKITKNSDAFGQHGRGLKTKSASHGWCLLLCLVTVW